MPISLTIDIGDAAVPRVVAAMSAHFGYEDQIPNEAGELIPNPENRRPFIKRMLALWVKGIVANYEAEQAAATARQEARDAAANVEVS